MFPKPRRSRRDPNMYDTYHEPPVLNGITVGGRVAVIFSDLDITRGLLGIETRDCAGFQSESAFEIARNILLYATDSKVP